MFKFYYNYFVFVCVFQYFYLEKPGVGKIP